MAEQSARLWSRRRLLEQSAFIAGNLALTGCLHTTSKLPTGPLITAGIDPNVSPLTIDAHCHIFNGTDLQVADFIGRVFAPNPVALAAAKLLQAIVWTTAPDGDEELTKLRSISAPLTKQSAGFDFDSSRKDSYIRARNAVLAARNSQSFAEPLIVPHANVGAKAELSEQLNPLVQQHQQDIVSVFEQSPDLDSFHANVSEKQAQSSPHIGAAEVRTPEDLLALEANKPSVISTVAAAAQFIAQYFRLRYVCAQDYLDTFTVEPHRDVHLMFAALVDYDWWLAQGHPTVTILPTQIEVMQAISVKSLGQVHGFAPFCPLREVAFRSGHLPPTAAGPGDPKNFSSLHLVQNAVKSSGFIGVKLYPPMGFAPYGNGDIQARTPGFWTPLGLDWLERPIQMKGNSSPKSFGACLDQVLLELYVWCAANGVPILSHTNETNGISSAFKDLAGPDYWKAAFEAVSKQTSQKIADLHVNFGHIGDFGDLGNSKQPTSAPPALAQGFLDLMGGYSNAFGDAAYSDAILSDAALLTERVEYVKEPRDFYSSYLYGTDWSLLMLAGHNRQYFEDFINLFAKIDDSVANNQGASRPGSRRPSERFFGWNAVDYAGLRKDNPTRRRLDTFYQSNKVPKPEWASKVDQ